MWNLSFDHHSYEFHHVLDQCWHHVGIVMKDGMALTNDVTSIERNKSVEEKEKEKERILEVTTNILVKIGKRMF